ncbi:hypothetical protein P280DRAFT_550795 [Massarina eburnea CBS 473.64]|uniref:Uncharacterized protein n=1 Tax=Massarina eburnea CBS 473.64 TaxID=1395130 RepID=A0A6A6RVK2_9PLEO|nr:hypothetical protein P280DRAFT_550795 [Massarina eburnea CBS 473.64]
MVWGKPWDEDQDYGSSNYRIQSNDNNDRFYYFAFVVALGVGVVLLPPLALVAAGFAAAGITAGSVAALWQSNIGNVAAGSLFAILQSIGATGIAWVVAVRTAFFAGIMALVGFVFGR